MTMCPDTANTACIPLDFDFMELLLGTHRSIAMTQRVEWDKVARSHAGVDRNLDDLTIIVLFSSTFGNLHD